MQMRNALLASYCMYNKTWHKKSWNSGKKVKSFSRCNKKFAVKLKNFLLSS